MRSARASRIRGPLALIAWSLPLFALIGWGCSLDHNGSYKPATPDAGAGGEGNGGAGGAPTLCGNGTLDGGEECDDGNADAGDGCDSDCKVECEVPEDLEGTAFKDEATLHCYLHIHDVVAMDNPHQPWYDALYLCRAHGFDLAALTTTEEQTSIEAFIEGDNVWTGGNDQVGEDAFVWSNGEPWAFDDSMPFDDGEPNDNDHSENCVEFNGPSELNDDACSDNLAYLCERHPPGACGDGVIDPAEECDDGNADLGDGCDFCVVICDNVVVNGSTFKDPRSGHCYIHDDNSMPWQTARETCEAIPGFHFATLSSNEERDFILSNAVVSGAWIGAHDNFIENDWVWTNGESWEFDPWIGDPDNTDGKDCLRFVFDDLDAAACSEVHPYLCERPPAGRRSPDAP